MWLFVLFVAIPILEIALFIQVGGWLGLWPTLAIVIATALAGTVLVRTQGLSTIRTLQERLEKGGDPTGPIAHGAMILASGLLLLTPGFFTDTVGFALLVPGVRSWLMKALVKHFADRVTVVQAGRQGPGPGHGPHQRPGPGAGRGRPNPPDTVEGDYTRLDPDDIDGPPGESGWTKRN